MHEIHVTSRESKVFCPNTFLQPESDVARLACSLLQAAESKLAMMEANEEQLRQRQERRSAEKEEENRLIQIMLNKFKVRHCGLGLVGCLHVET